jgi:hypothetical protein
MSPSHPDVTPVDTGDTTHTRTTDAGAAKCPHVTSVEATDASSTEATHVSSTKAAAEAATMSAAATTAAAGLRTSSYEAAGKQRSCQNHHPSTLHDLSPLEWAFRPGHSSDAGGPQQGKRQRRDRLEDGNCRPDSPIKSLSIIGLKMRRLSRTHRSSDGKCRHHPGFFEG